MNFRMLPMILGIQLCTTNITDAITIDTVAIGNPGNVNDSATGGLYGGVAYSYRIAKYDVTVGQYATFLNAVAATDTYQLYNASMATNANIAGISRSGSSGNYHYSVIGSPNHPVTYVNWGDAARFSNWLNNGQPGLEGPAVLQNAASTEAGSYLLNGATTDATLNAVSRNTNAKWFIPTENEWYKAAYYDPITGHYWRYATGTNTVPISAPPGGTPNTANFSDDTTGYAVSGTNIYSASQNYLTDVGAYTASASPYGTFDQAGNVFQWNEAIIGSFRGLRGGAWISGSRVLPSSARSSAFNPTLEDNITGFRVATLLTPSAGGDFNRNGVVDAADYSLWRDTLGSTMDLRADGDGDGRVGLNDYQVWRTSYGNTTGISAAVPEPCTANLVVISVASIFSLLARGNGRSQEPFC